MGKKKSFPIREYKDFRSLSIFPDYDDVNRATNPSLPSNIVKGKFPSGERYLEIHFLLNREDFVRPFRDGVKEYRKAIQRRKHISELKNIRIYMDAHIREYNWKNKPKNILHASLQFNSTNLKHICWHVSKRLIKGSLVCLTANNFQSLCFATVCGERDIEQLYNGIINIEIMPDSIEKFFQLYDNSPKYLIMAESVEYYEYYKSTLRELQYFTVETFPFVEYIIEVSKNIKIVPYLTESSIYDLSFVSSNKLPSVNNFLNKLFLENINISNGNDWPNHDLLDFDPFQYEAFKHALTKRLAIIQGPPGTGKTFAGLRIAQTLLQNKIIWNKNKSKRTPIVIVAKTNHALDQFLEGLVPYCRKDNYRLVRIGCQSKSEILKKYELDLIIKLSGDSLFAKKYSNYFKCSLADIHLYYHSIIDKLNYHFMTANEIKLLDQSIYGDLIAQLNKYNDNNVCLALIKWLIPNFSVELKPEYMISEKQENSDDDSANINDDIDEMIEDCDFNLSELNSFDNIADYLLSLFSNLCISDKEKIEIQNKVATELKSNDVMSEEEAYFVHDIMRLKHNDRWRLYRSWVSICTDKVRHELFEIDKKYREEVFDYYIEKRELIKTKGCDIIGLTTTGAAKNRDLIAELNPSIVIIEEAAEVLESQVITALTKSTCHLILIGDHRQLRPNPAVYELAVNKNLDVSMFERLIRNRLPYSQLKVQHRMCPSISSLLVPHFYDELIDHESVKTYETIRGVSKHVYFINHSQPESSPHDSTSKLNNFEAEFLARLCKYLTQQEYSQSQITILTMYAAQCLHLRTILKQCKPSLSKVRVAVVDNFQGEENDIILLSFVRSNSSGKIGFVKTANRVNVALSRAKQGMYCIGNFDCLSQNTQLWKNLKADFIEKDIFSDSLEIYCQNHPQRRICVSEACDFNKASEGGCDKRCEKILKCNHKCPLLCHTYDKNHERVACKVQCTNIICDSKHECQKPCHLGMDCGKCFKFVKKRIPNCKHEVLMACYYDPSEFHCPKQCNKKRSCGHRCKYSCGYNCDQFPCKVEVSRRLVCSHKKKLRCCDDISTAYCSKKLACGHACGDKCGTICADKSHKIAFNQFSSLN